MHAASLFLANLKIIEINQLIFANVIDMNLLPRFCGLQYRWCIYI